MDLLTTSGRRGGLESCGARLRGALWPQLLLFGHFHVLLLVLAPGAEIPASGASLKLDAQPERVGRREMKNREADFFFPLLN